MPTAPGPIGKNTGPASGFKSATRVQVSFVTAAEKHVLAWFAARMPAWVSSDRLTVLGFAAQIMVGVSYAMSRYDRNWLLWSVLFLAVNWFGDSLDGTVARFRNRQRPRYGFYVDHVIDAIGSTALMGGLAISGFMAPLLAMWLLVVFLLLAIEVYLATYTVGNFHLSFFNLGPTEIRIILAVGNIAVYLRGPWAHLSGHTFRLFDLGAIAAIIGMGTMFVFATVEHTVQLYREERLP
jgi:archaetidylinositol phosphate synthase